jgi:TetR/AcrR family transcriptional repressor of nem operon
MSNDTHDLLLRTAERLIRTRGYSAFSFADLATTAGITKASVHYHFPTKEELLLELYEGYMPRFVGALEAIRTGHATASDRLNAYAGLFLDGFEQGMLPICGALSAERAALPPAMLPKVEAFFHVHIEWLNGIVTDGIKAGELRPGIDIDKTVMLLLSTLEGGSFVAWAMARKDPVLAAFEAALSSLLI